MKLTGDLEGGTNMRFNWEETELDSHPGQLLPSSTVERPKEGPSCAGTIPRSLGGLEE